MYYHLYELNHAVMAPFRAAAGMMPYDRWVKGELKGDFPNPTNVEDDICEIVSNG